LTAFPQCGNNGFVTQDRRRSPLSLIWLLAAVVGLAQGCTALDDYLPGTPFTPDQPAGEVTVVGAINADRIELSTEDCAAGGTIFWGTARNTGDLDLNDVFIVIDAFGPSGALLGTYRTNVFNGEVTAADTTEPGAFDIASTSLAVDQSGTFDVCAPLPHGSVARTDYRTEFIVVEASEAQ
jgi:hypothetical protein